MAKLKKTDVNYSRGLIHSHCGKCFSDDKGHCQHFIGRGYTTSGTCEIVEGTIEPIMWCERFKKTGK